MKPRLYTSLLASKDRTPDKLNYDFYVELTPLSEVYVVGQPMLFKAEAVNESDKTLYYLRNSFAVRHVLQVIGPDKAPLKRIGQGACTTIGYEPIEPGERALLLDDYDLSEHYAVTEPGRYEVQFEYNLQPADHDPFLKSFLKYFEQTRSEESGRHQTRFSNRKAPWKNPFYRFMFHSSKDDGLYCCGYPGTNRSNIVILEVLPGTPSPKDVVYGLLNPLVPYSWHIEVFRREKSEATSACDVVVVEFSDALPPPQPDPWIQVWIISESPDDTVNMRFAPVYLGKTEWGEAYLAANEAALAEWSNHRVELTKALGLE